MNLLTHKLSINSDQFLTNSIDNLHATIKSFVNEKAINIKQVVQTELSINVKDIAELETVRNNFKALLGTIFKSSIPAFNILPESNLEQNQASLTFSLLKDNIFQLECKEFQNHCYTLCRSTSDKVIFSGTTFFDIHGDFLRSVQMTLDFMEQLLDHEEMHFGHIINQSIRIGDNFLIHKSEEQSPWTSTEQVMQLYTDPTLVKQGLAPLNLISHNSFGIIGHIMAASKDTFPIHLVYELNTDQYSTDIAFINNWKQAWFNTHINTETKPNLIEQNIIDQCKGAIKLTQEEINAIALKNNAKYQINHLIVYLSHNSGFEDIKQIIEQQIPANQIEYIQTNLRNPNALIELIGIASLNG